MQTLAPDSFCPLTNPQPYQRDQAELPRAEARIAANKVLKMDIKLDIGTVRGWLERLVRGKRWRNHEQGRLKKCETVGPKRSALVQAGSMAVAVLTPRNNDLESGACIKAARLISRRMSAKLNRGRRTKR